MKKVRLVLVIFYCILINYLNAQPVFRKGFTGVDAVSSIEPIGNSGYIFCGTDSSIGGLPNLALFRTDARGTVQWSKSYGVSTISETGKKVLATPDGGCLAIGSADSNSAFICPFVIKTDSSGVVQWAKYYRTLTASSPAQFINDAIIMADSGFVFAGSSFGNFSLLMRVDKYGNVIWTNCHQGTGMVYNRIILLPGGNMLAVGSLNNICFVAHLDANGNLISGKTYQAMGTSGVDVIATSDSNYVIVGKSTSQVTIMKMSLSGNIFWATAYGVNMSYYTSITELPSGSFILTTFSSTLNTLIFKIDSQGLNAFVASFAAGWDQFADRMKSAVDGGFVYVSNRHWIKFNSQGAYSCGQLTQTPPDYILNPVGISQNPTSQLFGISQPAYYNVTGMNITTYVICGGKCNATDNMSAAFSSPDSVCLGDNVNLVNASAGTGLKYKWLFDGLEFDTVASPFLRMNVAGEHTIRLVISNASNCKDTSFKKIFVWADCGNIFGSAGYFEKTYSNFSDGNYIMPVSDKGFILTGSSSLSGNPDVCLVKTDSSGSVEWGFSCGSSTINEIGVIVKQTNDGGYLAVSPGNHVFLIKSDATGNLMWSKNLRTITPTSSATSNSIRDMIITPDNGAIIVGSASTTYGLLFKIDSLGNVVWVQNTLGSGSHSYDAIIQISSGNYVVCGRSAAFTIILEIDQNGNLIWAKKYSSNGGLIKITQVEEGNLILSIDNANSAIRVMKVDSVGNLIWSRESPSGLMNITSVSTDLHNRTIYAGTGTNESRFYKLNSSGFVVSQQSRQGGSYPIKASKIDDASMVALYGNVLRKIATSNEFVTCNITSSLTTMNTHSVVADTINFTFNNYVVPVSINNLVTITSHAVTNICSDAICDANAEFFCKSKACTNEIIQLTNSSINAQGYVWYENNVPFSTNPDEIRVFTTAGTYSIRLEAYGASGCVNSYTRTITVGPAFNTTISPGVSINCGNSTTLFATGGSTYAWSPGTGLSDPYAQSTFAAPLSTTNYSVEIGNGTNCFITRSVTVTVGTTLNVSISGTSNNCSGNPTTLLALGASTYTWQPGNLTGSLITVAPVDTTTYTVIGSLASCTGTASFTVNALPLPIVTASADTTTICQNDQVTLHGYGANNYTWVPGNLNGASVTVTPQITTTYTVTGNDSNQCENTASVTINVNPIPMVIYGQSPNTVCHNGSPITLSPGIPSGGTYSGPGVTGSQFDPSIAGAGIWDVSYSFTDVNGCTGVATQQIAVNNCSGIQNPDGMNNIRIHPNPFRDAFVIEAPALPVLIRIINPVGEVVMEKSIYGTTTVNTNGIANGIYLLEIRTNNSLINRKLVKSRF